MARLFTKRVSQIILIILTLFLMGTIFFLWAVKSYFSISESAIIRTEELGTWSELRLGATIPDRTWKSQHTGLAKSLTLTDTAEEVAVNKEDLQFSDAIAKQAKEAAQAAGFGNDDIEYIPTGRDNSPKVWNSTTDPPEKIPRIIHQTWKDSTLPLKWQAVRDECSKMHPDYEYKLWTDGASRQFLVENYPWFIPVFDSYPYPIQRADAIRYFILHYYGGIYMDLDVGCLRRFDPLLRFEVILPKTIPVGVSNDVMASAPRHEFMDLLIHNLITFNHRYLTHYPTVMFSTGPMFVSASYGLFVDAHGQSVPSTPENITAGFSGIRVLPKALYGKNAKPSEAPDAFFRHFYGSSWHAGDADFLIFLREHGRLLIVLGFVVVGLGLSRNVSLRYWSLLRPRVDRRRRSSQRRGRWISLPFIQDPTSGQYRSVSGDILSRTSRRRNLLDESTQTGQSTGSASLGNPLTKVAAPQPQRASMPLFELREGEISNGSDDEADMDSTASSEKNRWERKNEKGGMFSWMQRGQNLSLSHDDGPRAGPSDENLRVGSASKLKEKTNSILYLPAYLVGASSGSSAGSTTDSALTSVRVGQDGENSPAESTSSRAETPNISPWNLTKPHSRSISTQNIGYNNWSASFSGANTETLGRQNSSSSSSTISKVLGGVSLNARTPSPGLFLNAFRPMRTDDQSDLECGGKEKADLDSPQQDNGPANGSQSALLVGPQTSSLRRSPSVSNVSVQPGQEDPGLENDVILGSQNYPPPPYESNGSSTNSTTGVE